MILQENKTGKQYTKAIMFFCHPVLNYCEQASDIMPFISNEVSTTTYLVLIVLVHQHCVLRLDEYLDLNFELDIYR
jgi:hypothetical protein